MTPTHQGMLVEARPWAHATAARLGVGPADGRHEDAVQAAMLKLTTVVARYDPRRGMAWRTYAIMVLRNAVIDFVEYESRRQAGGGADAAERPSPPPAVETVPLPRLYRRALAAGVGAARPAGLPKPAAERVLRCSQAAAWKLVDDLP